MNNTLCCGVECVKALLHSTPDSGRNVKRHNDNTSHRTPCFDFDWNGSIKSGNCFFLFNHCLCSLNNIYLI